MWSKPLLALSMGKYSVVHRRRPVKTLLMSDGLCFHDSTFFFAVPTTHSRKPSPYSIFEPFLRERDSGIFGRKDKPGPVLEMFARNLNRGWVSWGNEVLKFQTDPYIQRKLSQEM
eukprot:Rmarinus@m.3950